MQMPYVSIVGAAGYTGQETLDRVLRHPELELYAVGSDSLAGRDATALDPRLNRNGGKRVPRLITNAAALACEADVTFLCLSHEEAAAYEPPARGVVVDLSGAHRLSDPASTRSGTASRIPGRTGSASGRTRSRSCSRRRGRLVANPGCYATAVLLALGPIAGAIDQGSVVVDAMSGMTGAGRSPKPSTHAGSVLENVSPYRVGSHQHVAEIAQVLGFPVSFTPHLLPVRRGLLATCNVRSTGADLRALLEEHYAGSPLVTRAPRGRRSRARARPAHRRRRDRRLRGPAHRPDDRDLRARQPRQGRGRSGRAERQPPVRLRATPPGFGSPGCWSDVGHRGQGIRRRRRVRRDPAVREAGRRARRGDVPAVGCAMWTTNRVQAAPVVVSRRHLELAEPQAVVVNAGVANAATGSAGEEDARATAAHAAAPLGLEPEQVVVLSTGVIGPRLPMESAPCGRRRGRRRALPGGGPTAAEAILTTDAGPKTAVVEADGFTVGGMAKGAGMIHPCLATMLAVVTTDYPLAPGEADAFLRPAVERRFNRISVDGDCSTNDAVVLLAHGAAGSIATPRSTSSSPPRSRGSAPISPGRSSRTAKVRRSCSRSRSPVPPRPRRRTRSRGASRHPRS